MDGEAAAQSWKLVPLPVNGTGFTACGNSQSNAGHAQFCIRARPGHPLGRVPQVLQKKGGASQPAEILNPALGAQIVRQGTTSVVPQVAENKSGL
jgi:hypothetical protein